jgi:hypothetical protein
MLFLMPQLHPALILNERSIIVFYSKLSDYVKRFVGAQDHGDNRKPPAMQFLLYRDRSFRLSWAGDGGDYQPTPAD